MARIAAADVQLWTSIINAAIPGVSAGVQGVMAIIRLARRSSGQPEEQEDDEMLEADVAAALEEAKTPYQRILDRARDQLRQGDL